MATFHVICGSSSPGFYVKIVLVSQGSSWPAMGPVLQGGAGQTGRAVPGPGLEFLCCWYGTPVLSGMQAGQSARWLVSGWAEVASEAMFGLSTQQHVSPACGKLHPARVHVCADS